MHVGRDDHVGTTLPVGRRRCIPHRTCLLLGLPRSFSRPSLQADYRRPGIEGRPAVALAWPLDTMHTTSTLILILAVFGASSVEMVEALTIVVAAGVSRGWRSALEGAATAVLVLALLVGFIGVPLIHYVPIDTLRVVVGALLLVLGLAWLRKAILRASGHKAPHDEDKIYAETVAELTAEEEAAAAAAGTAPGAATKARDGVAFAVAFKGVFLEGTEVVLIVISLGAAQNKLGLAALAAAAAA